MTTGKRHVRHGFGSVRPYIYGGLELPAFVEYVFDAKSIERHEFNEQSWHYEGQIGDSVIVIEAGELPAHQNAIQSSIYVYVEDVDATFARALERGAVKIAEPENKPYQERNAGFRDAAGNTWWISTFTG